MIDADEQALSALDRAKQEERTERDAQVQAKTELSARLATSLAARPGNAPKPESERRPD